MVWNMPIKSINQSIMHMHTCMQQLLPKGVLFTTPFNSPQHCRRISPCFWVLLSSDGDVAQCHPRGPMLLGPAHQNHQQPNQERVESFFSISWNSPWPSEAPESTRLAGITCCTCCLETWGRWCQRCSLLSLFRRLCCWHEWQYPRCP